MDEDRRTALEGLAKIPLFQGRDLDKVKVERLGGLTNLVYRIADDSGVSCLRIPGKGTEDYIDRKVEAHNAKVAAASGVSPEVLYCDPESGLMLSRYLEGCETMTPERFCRTAAAPARAGQAFRRLHDHPGRFEFRFELFAMIDDYLALLAPLGAALPDGYHDVIGEAGPVREALAAHPLPLAPCHCDPLCENFLDDGQRMWIVDWEYSGMNDPLWDLGDLSVEAGFSDAQDREMIAAYFPGAPRASEVGRIVIYKAMCDLLWTLWGLIQHAKGNPAEDFWAYATNRFERCKALMATETFAGHVDAVRAPT